MKIISKFHDYYDSGLGLGHDDGVVFVREQTPRLCISKSSITRGIDSTSPVRIDIEYQSVYEEFKSFFHKQHSVKFGGKVQLIGFGVIFCGKVYPGICVVPYEMKKDQRGCNYTVYDFEKVSYCYSEDDLRKVLAKFDFPKKNTRAKLEYYFGDKTPSNKKELQQANEWFGLTWWNKSRLDDVLCKSFFSAPDVSKIDAMVNMRLVSAVVSWNMAFAYYVLNQNYVVENLPLQQIQFYKALDHYLAFQEIEMFISGVLPNNEADMSNIEDKYLAAAKGFDKWSFRTMPENKNKKA